MTAQATQEVEALRLRLTEVHGAAVALLRGVTRERDLARSDLAAVRATIAEAPRLQFTVTPTVGGTPARTVIHNLDPINVKAGESVVFRLVRLATDEPEVPA